jgi:flagellar hook assembly protein FlgD
LVGAKIQIFNIAGELVQGQLEDTSGIGKITWDGTNNAGKMVASGIYIAHIEVGSKNTGNLKFAVVK